MKEYLEKQENMDLYRSEYGNVEEEISVINRVVSNGQEAMIQAAQRITGMGSQGKAQQGDSLSSWAGRNGIQLTLKFTHTLEKVYNFYTTKKVLKQLRLSISMTFQSGKISM